MTPSHMLSAPLLLTVAQASSLYPASTVPLKGISRSPRFGDEGTLYTGFQPPLPQMSYDADYDDVASARSLGESMSTNNKYNMCHESCEQLHFLQIFGKLGGKTEPNLLKRHFT